MKHAKFFCKSCLVCCETTSFVKFSLIICRKVENNAISFRTFVYVDVSVGEILWNSVFSNIDI